MKRTTVNDLHKEWMNDLNYRREYEVLEEGFSLAASLIEARARAGLTQEQVAQRMKTTRGRATGGWQMQAVNADSSEICQGNRDADQNQL